MSLIFDLESFRLKVGLYEDLYIRFSYNELKIHKENISEFFKVCKEIKNTKTNIGFYSKYEIGKDILCVEIVI
jgi:hypothetical protein